MIVARFSAIVVCMVALHAKFAVAGELSPDHWPTPERAELQQREFFGFPPYAGPVSGRSSLVTGTLSPVAVHAGVEALRRGGTAADAAATVALTQVATALGSVVSYAGISELLYFDAKSGKVYALDAGWGSYAQETDPASIPTTDTSVVTGQAALAGAGVGALGRQTLVGGFMAGIEALHRRFGRLKFVELFQPAIWYAENGVIISPLTAHWFQQRQPQLWRTSAGRRFASMPDGNLPKVGDLFRQPELAHTLRAVATKGAGYMYTGDWAQSFVAAVRTEGGSVTLDDLARYKPMWLEPLSVEFGGTTVFGPAAGPSGTCSALEALNLLGSQHIATLGTYWRDPVAFRHYVNALHFAQFAHYSPDVAAFERSQGFSGGCRTRLTPQYAAAIGPHIESLMGADGGQKETGHHSDSVVVVDKWGNVAALVHSINAITWGDTGIVVGGIPIGDAAAVNRTALMRLQPGERVPHDMSPIIALEEGKPVLAVASIGASHMLETTRLVAGALGGSVDLQSLMSAPALLVNPTPPQHGETLARRAEWVPAGAYDSKLLQALADQGLPVQEIELPRTQALRGTAVIALIDQSARMRSTVEIPTIVAFAESERQRGSATPPEFVLSPPALDRYVGVYRTASDTVVRITRDTTHLFYEARGNPRSELIPESESQFFSKTSNTHWTFHFGASGEADEMVIHLGSAVAGIDRRAPRISAAEAAAIEHPATSSSAPSTTASAGSAETSAAVDATGDWIGSIAPAIRFGLHLHKTGQGEYEGTGDSPDYGAFGFPLQKVSVSNDTLSFSISTIAAQYDGKWDAAHERWDGQFHQSGSTTPLALSRGVFKAPPPVEGLDGDWHGVFEDTKGTGPLIHVEKTGSAGRLGLPSQRQYGIALSKIARDHDHIRMEANPIGATIEGELSADGRSIKGSFVAFGMTRPLTLTRDVLNAAGGPNR